ncbi:TetR/AcrR family transcriptional regulator [Schaalia hyovaginalis]|uniref:TetR/AcrR family transcriptional regulator n=1 Tax=Schaalia hyovaginalis TaxID=29316 RepID=UPI0012B1CB13|nr:helix-turn-helix domain-containing protein [Schaalia hyovaginalis]MCF2710536.1 helix-turn-helix transcriptional regulator [Schaalia hyovaginalis]MCI6411914.1 TetR/AcrR family transcriptional regulator [Schaalia hyovaginalis]MDY3665324.1 helix-turn-helix domain-containing protein [Schaalia hyovaginalis]MDY4491462.1 helix-turn-helix domain-containing protein [Schaalia hyovaginalis]MST64340.1 helix-turn-helix transcriptional regulator [Schaalia hyovaginalis]
MPPSSSRPRVRMSAEQRREQIVEVATGLVARYGFTGLSLQDVADAVGITQAGLLHYIGNKNGLLRLLLFDRYDKQGTPQDFLDSGAPGAIHPEGMSLPAYFRFLTAFNEARPSLMELYMTLGAEATDPGHPVHDYFRTRPDAVWDYYSGFTWRLPPEIEAEGGWATMRPLIEMAIEAMDGAQIRFFREPAISLVEEWARWEALLFPSPLWDDYR